MRNPTSVLFPSVQRSNLSEFTPTRFSIDQFNIPPSSTSTSSVPQQAAASSSSASSLTHRGQHQDCTVCKSIQEQLEQQQKKKVLPRLYDFGMLHSLPRANDQHEITVKNGEKSLVVGRSLPLSPFRRWDGDATIKQEFLHIKSSSSNTEVSDELKMLNFSNLQSHCV